MTPFLDDGDQSDMAHEINVHKERDFFFRKMSFCAEEAEVHRLKSCVDDGGAQSMSIRGFKSAYFNLAAVARALDRRVFGCFNRHPKSVSLTPQERFELVQTQMLIGNV